MKYFEGVVNYCQCVIYCFESLTLERSQMSLLTSRGNGGGCDDGKLRLVPSGAQQKETVMRVDCTLINNKSAHLVKLRKRFPKADQALLTAGEANDLLLEATTYVMSRNSLNKDMVTNNKMEKKIYATLRNMIVTGEQTLGSQSTKKEWRSVFWGEDSYRPDLVAKELDKVHTKLDRETQVKLVKFVNETNWSDSFDRILFSLLSIGNSSIAKSVEANGSEEYRLLLQKVRHCALASSVLHVPAKNLQISSKKSEKFEKRMRALANAFSNIKWQDGKFVSKPITLTRINLAELRKEQNWQQINNKANDPQVTSCEHNEEQLSVKIRRLEAQLNDFMSLEKKTYNETSRKMDALNTTINKLTQKMAKIENMVTVVANDTKKNYQQLDNKVNQFTEQLSKLISSARADSTTMNKTLDSKVELLKSDLLAKEASLRRVIHEEKEDVLRQVSNMKSINAREHEEMKSSLVSVKMHFEREAQITKKQSLDTAEKMTSQIAQVRQELSFLGSQITSVSQSVSNTQALLSKANASFEKETSLMRQESSDMSAKLNRHIEQVRSTVLHNASETTRQINHLKSFVSSLQQTRKVFFSAQVAEGREMVGNTLDFSPSCLLNEGWTIDLKKGIFTVPRDGCYALFFYSLAGRDEGQETKGTAVSLVCNEKQILASRAGEDQPLTLSIVQQLNSGDRLSVVLHHGALRLSVGEHTTGKYEKPLAPVSVFGAFSID